MNALRAGSLRGVSALTLIALAAPALAQHHAPPPDASTSDAQEHAEHELAAMATIRDGSGTAWLPESTPMRGSHLTAAGWRLMLHGHLAAGINWQGSDRGGDEAISTNWIMAMADRDVAGGALGLRAMLSLEPLTVGTNGYPLLLQSGEFAGMAFLTLRSAPASGGHH